MKYRNLVCGTPSILIKNGKIQQSAMRSNRYTLDELLEELREQGYFNIEAIRYAILENSGQLSVLPWAHQQPPTAAQLGLHLPEENDLPVVLISDGRILSENLTACGRNPAWLQKTLLERHISTPKNVFLMTLDEHGNILCIQKELPES